MNPFRLFFLLAWAWIQGVQASPKQTINIVTDDYCPYVCFEGDQPGISVEILNEIFKRRGMETKLFPVGWARALKMAEENKVDIIAAVSTYELKNIGWLPTQAMGPKFTASFFVSGKKDWRYRSIADLKGMKVGIIKGYVYPEPLESYVRKPENSPFVVEIGGVDAIPRLIKMLASGRIDTLPLSRPVFYFSVRGTPDKKSYREAGDLSLPDNPSICAGVRPGLKLAGIDDPVAFINESMLALKSDGTYGRILKSYGQTLD
jgi:polar amino acid transport system substrate-binding protein